MQRLQAPGHWQPVLRRVWMEPMGSRPVPQWALQAQQQRGTNQKALGPLGPLHPLTWQRLRWRRHESRSHTSLSL